MGFVLSERYICHVQCADGSHIGVDRVSKEPVEVRAISQDSVNLSGLVKLRREVSMLQKLDRLVEFYRSPSKYYIVSTLMSGARPLQSLIDEEKCLILSAASTPASSASSGDSVPGSPQSLLSPPMLLDPASPCTKSLAATILTEVEKLHERNIAHRNLSPATILISSCGSKASLRDFSKAALCGDMATDRHEFPEVRSLFSAPEVLRGEKAYDRQAADVWSLGMTLYYAMTGVIPFYKQGGSQYLAPQKGDHLEEILEGSGLSFHPEMPHNCEALLSGMLCVDVSQRISLAEALSHPYIASLSDEGERSPVFTQQLSCLSYYTARSSGSRVSVLTRAALPSVSREGSHRDEEEEEEDEEGVCGVAREKAMRVVSASSYIPVVSFDEDAEADDGSSEQGLDSVQDEEIEEDSA